MRGTGSESRVLADEVLPQEVRVFEEFVAEYVAAPGFALLLTLAAR